MGGDGTRGGAGRKRQLIARAGEPRGWVRAGVGGRGVRAALARTGGVGAQGKRVGPSVAEGGKVVESGYAAARKATRAFARQCGRWGER